MNGVVNFQGLPYHTSRLERLPAADRSGNKKRRRHYFSSQQNPNKSPGQAHDKAAFTDGGDESNGIVGLDGWPAESLSGIDTPQSEEIEETTLGLKIDCWA